MCVIILDPLRVLKSHAALPPSAKESLILPFSRGWASWLRLNRDHWGIESGLHQRLDISHNDDRCKVRNDNAMLVLGMMLRLSNSLFIQWSRNFGQS